MGNMKGVAGLVLAAASGTAGASGVTTERIALMGNPRAASEGTVLREQLENRPLLRTGELHSA